MTAKWYTTNSSHQLQLSNKQQIDCYFCCNCAGDYLDYHHDLFGHSTVRLFSLCLFLETFYDSVTFQSNSFFGKAISFDMLLLFQWPNEFNKIAVFSAFSAESSDIWFHFGIFWLKDCIDEIIVDHNAESTENFSFSWSVSQWSQLKRWNPIIVTRTFQQ